MQSQCGRGVYASLHFAPLRSASLESRSLHALSEANALYIPSSWTSSTASHWARNRIEIIAEPTCLARSPEVLRSRAPNKSRQAPTAPKSHLNSTPEPELHPQAPILRSVEVALDQELKSIPGTLSDFVFLSEVPV